MSQRGLFGGAITIVYPPNLIDVSEIRQVPDTQEVFVAADSDVSFIVEVLERVDPPSPNEAVRHVFDALAHDNSAVFSEVLNVTLPEQGASSLKNGTPTPILLSGVQHVQKFNRTAVDKVHIFLALYRIDSKNVDLVLSVNVHYGAEGGPPMDSETLGTIERQYLTAASSLHIVDFTLFA
ncbi:Mog1p/PsbP-like protein [Sistotremastrum suecicum HHB10207 ss-3]|uniref:Mog1p/PsbP-like protein n=1 Tax=Sistotremastrum suecicum HHB10207 ss-3 TaxID=1314776 RepID=A0A166IX27_9AGAM|nr:Mog1p/PsbP-like protein [Sistotremastrum suecicum HHB10207 ss-3]